MDDLFKSLDIDKGKQLVVEKVHPLHFWLVQRSVLVKEKVGGLKGDLTRK